jgi:hypothetical protein
MANHQHVPEWPLRDCAALRLMSGTQVTSCVTILTNPLAACTGASPIGCRLHHSAERAHSTRSGKTSRMSFVPMLCYAQSQKATRYGLWRAEGLSYRRFSDHGVVDFHLNMAEEPHECARGSGRPPPESEEVLVENSARHAAPKHTEWVGELHI